MNNKIRRTFATAIAAPVAGLMLFAAPAQSASLSFFLDQSNILPDGTNYVQVTIADGAKGAIDFTVSVLQPLLDIAGPNFGLQMFAFNVGGESDARARDVSGLPSGWTARGRNRMSEFGVFDIKLSGRGDSRVSTLEFSIDGVDGDSPADYVGFSRRNASGGNQFFAAKVGGFDYCRETPNGEKCFSSGFFAGSTQGTAVPLPASAWLLLTGFVAVAARARRRLLG
jgi:hypothetical protein